MKGRDALILEMMLAARRYGLEDRVAESIKGPGETVPFTALAERVLCALAVHASVAPTSCSLERDRARRWRRSGHLARRLGGAAPLGQLDCAMLSTVSAPRMLHRCLAAIDELSGRSDRLTPDDPRVWATATPFSGGWR